jgi:16S rRNA (uracil1498-N3)-methyltransferase
MPENRFFTHEKLEKSKTLTLQGEELRHLAVMRLMPEDTLEIINGKGALAVGRVCGLNKKEARLEVNEVTQEAERTFPLIIAQAIPRPSRLDIILEKGTELGMTKLILFPGEQSEKTSFTQEQLHRIEKVLIAAIKQCGRLWLPEIEIAPPLLKWKELPCPVSYFGDFREGVPTLFSAWRKNPPQIQSGALFIVGPEKGLTEREEKHLEDLGGVGVTLHKNVLRTDTAPLCALSLMSHFILGSLLLCILIFF